LTIIVDDAGSGDLLFGVVIGVYREETSEFKYDLIDVRFYQELFCEKTYLQEASRVTSQLVAALKVKPDEEIHVCQGCIFDVAVADLQKVYGEERVSRVKVTGEAQRLVEIAYLDEIRNLGYEPLAEREAKRRIFLDLLRYAMVREANFYKFQDTTELLLSRKMLYDKINKSKLRRPIWS